MSLLPELHYTIRPPHTPENPLGLLRQGRILSVTVHFELGEIEYLIGEVQKEYPNYVS